MKTFTIEQANATLPLVRAIVSDLVELSVEVAERRQRVGYLLKHRRKNENDPYWQELAAMEVSLQAAGSSAAISTASSGSSLPVPWMESSIFRGNRWPGGLSS